MRQTAITGLFLLLALTIPNLLTACDSEPKPRTEHDYRFRDSLGQIGGSIFFRERASLPPDAVYEVELLDLSNPSNPRTLVSSGEMQPASGPPYDFLIQLSLPNMDRQKLENTQYGLRATIRVHGEVLYANEDFVDLTSGEPKLILVHRLPAADRSP